MSTGPEAPSRMPPVSAILSVVRMLVAAYLRSRPRKESEEFLRELGAIVADEETIHPLFPNRPQSERASQRVAQAEAAEWIRNVLPLWIASLRRK